jgi:hypothetical protein
MYVRIEVDTGSAPTDLQLEDRLQASFLTENRLMRHRLADVVEFDRREAWSIDGARSMVDWLCYRFDLAVHTAHEYLRVGRALEFLPALADAFEEGYVSWDKLRAVVPFATPDEDVVLARDLPMLNTAQVLMLARHRRRLARDHAARRRRQRFLRPRWDADEGMLHIWAQIPDADGALVLKTIDALATEAARTRDGGFAEPYDRRCADALVALCGERSALSSGHPVRSNVTVYADAAMLAAEEGTATVEGGIAIAPETLRRLTCDGRLRTVATTDGRTIGVGRMRRTVPSWLYEELMKRDAQCRWDGCTSKRWLHAHHIEHWAHGGKTDADNPSRRLSHPSRTVREADNGGSECRRRRPSKRPRSTAGSRSTPAAKALA